MFIVSKRNLIIPGEKGREEVSIARDFMGEVPDWVGGSAYFQALVKDGKVLLSEGGGPKEPRKPKEPKKPAREKPKPPAEEDAPPELPAEGEGASDGD